MKNHHVTKVLNLLKETPLLFKNKNVTFKTGLTSSDLNKIKKIIKQNKLATFDNAGYQITIEGTDFINQNPIITWKQEPYNLRYETNLEYLKAEKTPPAVSKAINILARHFLYSEPIKDYSVEGNILLEISSENEDLKYLKSDIEKYILSQNIIEVSEYFKKYQAAPYGLTKSIASILLLEILAKNKNNILIYKLSEIELNFNHVVFGNIIGCPDRHKLKKTVFEENQLLFEISKILLDKPTYNILDITKGLISFVKTLNHYTLNTKTLNKKTLKFRNAILSADDPINLFCKEIPTILCKQDLNNCSESLIEEFKNCISELKNKYNNFLSELIGFVLQSFGETNRSILCTRLVKLKEYLNSKELQVLSNNIVDVFTPENLWIERIAICINKSLAPEDWEDTHAADFKIKLKGFSNIYLKIEEIAFNLGECANSSNKLNIEKAQNIISVLSQFSKSEQAALFKAVMNS